MAALTPGGGPHLPLRQPRRPADPAARGCARARSSGRSRRAGCAGSCWPPVLVGFAFLTKYLQAYLVAAGLRADLAGRRAGLDPPARSAGSSWRSSPSCVASGWWVAIVELIPAASRPYIGGSTTNSVLDLIFGYDGLGRIFGQGGPARRWRRWRRRRVAAAASRGAPGPAAPVQRRVRRPGQLAPAARARRPASAACGSAAMRPHGPTPGGPATSCGAAGSLVHAAVFSFMSGIIHSYYAVVMAPAIGALVGAGRRGAVGGCGAGRAWAGLALGAGDPRLGRLGLGAARADARLRARPRHRDRRGRPPSWRSSSALPARDRRAGTAASLLAAGLGVAMLLAGAGRLRDRHDADRLLGRRPVRRPDGQRRLRRRVHRRWRWRRDHRRQRAGVLPARQPRRAQRGSWRRHRPRRPAPSSSARALR